MAYKNKIDEYRNYLNSAGKPTESSVASYRTSNNSGGGKGGGDSTYWNANKPGSVLSAGKDDTPYWQEHKPGQLTPQSNTGTSGSNTPTMPSWDKTNNGWYQQMQDLMGQITNRPDFTFDLDANALYQQYKQNYMKMGQQAMQDTMGQAAALTGGYGSSYGQAVGNQAYNDYLTKLGDVVPELYAQERAAYDQEGQNLYNLLNAAQGMYGLDYGEYRDALGDYRYSDELSYNRGRDALSDQRYADELAYNRNRDSIADQRYADERDYNRSRDQINDQRYADERDYNRSRDQESDRRYNQEWEYNRSRDQINDQRYEDERDYSRGRDAINDQRYADETAYGRGQDAYNQAMDMLTHGMMPTADQLAAAGIPSDQATYFYNYYRSQMNGTGSGGTGGSGGGGSQGTTPGSTPRYTPPKETEDDDEDNTPTGTEYPADKFNLLMTQIESVGSYAAAARLVDKVASQLSPAQVQQITNRLTQLYGAGGGAGYNQ